MLETIETPKLTPNADEMVSDFFISFNVDSSVGEKNLSS